MQEIRSIIQEHPDYGYRRILPELRERTGRRINHKRLRRLLKGHELALPRCLPKRTPSPVREIVKEAAGSLNLVKGRRGAGCLEVFSTDFTEVPYAEGQRKAHLMAVVDIRSRYVLGWALGRSANTELAMRCWEAVRTRAGSQEISLSGCILHSDLDTVYTSYRWLRALLIDDGMRVSYSERGAKDNPWIEALWGRMKTEIGSKIDQAQTFSELEAVLAERFRYYNQRRRHSSLGMTPPLTYLTNHHNTTHDSPLRLSLN